eukprot:1138500-Pelagomonas_calceolata.AAC.1
MRSAIPAAMRAGGGAFNASRPAMFSFSSSPPMSYGFAASAGTSPTSSSGSGSSGLSGGGSAGDGVAADGAEGAGKWMPGLSGACVFYQVCGSCGLLSFSNSNSYPPVVLSDTVTITCTSVCTRSQFCFKHWFRQKWT